MEHSVKSCSLEKNSSDDSWTQRNINFLHLVTPLNLFPLLHIVKSRKPVECVKNQQRCQPASAKATGWRSICRSGSMFWTGSDPLATRLIGGLQWIDLPVVIRIARSLKSNSTCSEGSVGFESLKQSECES